MLFRSPHPVLASPAAWRDNCCSGNQINSSVTTDRQTTRFCLLGVCSPSDGGDKVGFSEAWYPARSADHVGAWCARVSVLSGFLTRLVAGFCLLLTLISFFFRATLHAQLVGSQFPAASVEAWSPNPWTPGEVPTSICISGF